MEGFIALIVILFALGIWYVVDRKSFLAVFTFQKPTPPVGYKKPPVSTAVERMPQHVQSGYEDIGSINEPKQAPAPKRAPRHEIIRHDYYKAFNGNMWPQWTCKCGASDKEPTSIYDPLEKTQQTIRRKGEKHVADATTADEMMERSNGKFAF